jgi:hypothetical protein
MGENLKVVGAEFLILSSSVLLHVTANAWYVCMSLLLHGLCMHVIVTAWYLCMACKCMVFIHGMYAWHC